MNLRPIVIFAVLLVLIALFFALIAYDRNNSLDQERLIFATERVEIANQALDDGATQAAATRLVDATQAAEMLGGVRNAASTLQAGSLATREQLEDSLAGVAETATQGAMTAATADADAQAAQAAFAAAGTAQADQLADAQNTIAEAATEAVATAASMATQQALASTLEAEVNALETQLAEMATNPPTPRPTAAASTSASSARPTAQVAIGALLYADGFDADSSFVGQDIAGAGSSRLEDGQLVLTTIEQPQRELTLLTESTISDALVEIDIASADCSERSLLLLEIRDDQDGSNGYAVGVNCTYDVWGVFKRSGGQIERLVTQPIELTNLDPAGPHVLSVEARADTLTAYLDGERLGTISDSAQTEGAIGFTLVADSNANVHLDNLRAWALGAPAANATATPQPLDSRIERDALISRFPSEFETDSGTWRVQSEPSLDLSEQQVASVAYRLTDADSGARAGVIVIYATDTQTLAAIVNTAETDLQIERFDDVPADFPEPNIFGPGSDGLDAWWVQGSAVVRVTIIDTDNMDEADLIALARAVRDVVADE
ncbi:MAG: hypothetical protein IT320_24030 [Anaerolineae bacterium]|nr:hypothetical protein [Anaerolineae bacterium]